MYVSENENLYKLSCILSYHFIIPTSRDCTHIEQFDWLKEMFYFSINSVSKHLRTIFLPSALKIHNYFDKNEILMTELEL